MPQPQDAVAPGGTPVAPTPARHSSSEAALRDSEERYRTFIRLSSEGIWRFEGDPPIPTGLPADEQVALMLRGGYLAECNDAMAGMYGFASAAELTGRKLSEFFDPADPRTVEYLSAFVAGGYRLEDAESVELDREGHPRVFLNSLAGVVENGRLVRAWGTQRDVTGQRRAEEAARRSEQRLRLLTDALPAMIAYVDAGHRYRFNNRAYLDWFGKSFEQLEGRHLRDALGEEVYAQRLPHVEAALRGEAVRFEGPTIHRDKGPRHTEVSYVPDVAADGRVSGFYVMALDATDRARAEEARRLSEYRFQRLVEQSPLSVQLFAPDGTIRQVNRAWEKLWGVSPADIPGYSILTDAKLEALGVMPLVRRAFAGEAVTIEPIPYVAPEEGGHAGEVRWVGAYLYPVRGEAGDIEEVVLVHNDVTERKRAEQALADSQRRLQTLFDNTQDAILLADDAGRFVDANPAACGLTGYAREDLLRLNVWDVTPAPDRETGQRLWREFIQSGKQSGEYPLARRDGVAVSVEYRAVANVLPGLHLSALRDVTERRRAEAALRESEARFRAVVEATPECVKVVSPEGALVYMNAAGLCMVEADDEPSVRGASVFDLVAPEYREAWKANHERVCRGERLSWEFEVIGLRGTRRWMETHAVPLPTPDGGVAQLAVTREITARKRIEREREQLLGSERAARAEAERTSRLKDDFLANLSHELRTPLNAILGYAQLLRTGAMGVEELAEGLEVIERNARAQTQIIEDLLDMSRIMSGKVRLDVRPVDVAAVVREALDTVRPAADAKGVRLQPALDPNAGPVSGDPSRLQQCLWNLLSNAIKFTPRGGRVRVLVERVSSNVRVSVIDSGEGIPPAFLPHVFDRFMQADASTTRRHGGLGLGLSIVKQLVELHGGTVRAESGGPGQGAAFTVTLPLSPVQAAQAEGRAPPAAPGGRGAGGGARAALGGVRVLVVDDERDARDLLRRLLGKHGADVVTAASVGEALDALAGGDFSLILSDIGMPGSDGYHLIAEVRRREEGTGRRTPAVALTAFARSEDRTRALTAGYQSHVAKPVEPAELVATVASLALRPESG